MRGLGGGGGVGGGQDVLINLLNGSARCFMRAVIEILKIYI